MPVYGFQFPQDQNLKAGAVKPYRGGSDFVIPGVDVSGAAVKLTDTPLGASASYTQATQDRFGDVLVERVRCLAFANQAGTLYIEETDNPAGSWTTIATVSVSASALADTGYVTLTKRYFRARYVNGATAQTSFALYQALGAGLVNTQLTGSNAQITSFSSSVVLVGTTPTRLPSSPMAGRGQIAILNNSSQLVVIGGSNVSLADGYPIPPGTETVFTLNPNTTVDVYAVSETGGAEVRVLEAK